MIYGAGYLTPAVLRLLKAMAHGGDITDYEDYEAVYDTGDVWVGCERFKPHTLRNALHLCALSDVSDEGGIQRYVINATGRALLADPSQADVLLTMLYSGQNITIRDGRILPLDL